MDLKSKLQITIRKCRTRADIFRILTVIYIGLTQFSEEFTKNWVMQVMPFPPIFGLTSLQPRYLSMFNIIMRGNYTTQTIVRKLYSYCVGLHN